MTQSPTLHSQSQLQSPQSAPENSVRIRFCYTIAVSDSHFQAATNLSYYCKVDDSSFSESTHIAYNAKFSNPTIFLELL